MKNILLICSAGVTSANLVTEMRNSSSSKENNLVIWSVGVADVKDEITKADIVLLSPQSGYLKETLEDLIEDQTQIKILPADIYSGMNGNAVIEFALES